MDRWVTPTPRPFPATPTTTGNGLSPHSMPPVPENPGPLRRSALSRASTVGYRFSRRFSRHFLMILLSLFSLRLRIPPPPALGGGAGASPVGAYSPVRRKYSTAPPPYTSVLSSGTSPAYCSGAAHPGVPTAPPVSPARAARPKSTSFTVRRH